MKVILLRQFAEDDQVGRLEIGRLLGQLFDGVAAVLEDALVAVDVGDRALAGRGVHEAGVVGRQPRGVVVGLDLSQVGGADGAVGDRDLVLGARAVVADCQGVGGV